ncbi:hypothetical protein BLNAU_18343 [Blattamonas nauphoetae]|uniref:Uncharacterized protein n=1 Tax=Blattamonas nauphoetae TaxID=2049346 RepID=A0ABQ9X4X2_9EUKA|nr:hypothetical protein BLNAU_18343 [Blattamonas nauphoetae]
MEARFSSKAARQATEAWRSHSALLWIAWRLTTGQLFRLVLLPPLHRPLLLLQNDHIGTISILRSCVCDIDDDNLDQRLRVHGHSALEMESVQFIDSSAPSGSDVYLSSGCGSLAEVMGRISDCHTNSFSTSLVSYDFGVRKVQAYRSGTEKEKVSTLHEVQNKIEEDENGETMKEVGEMGLRMGFVSELCVTLGSECSPFLFVCLPSFLLFLPLSSSFSCLCECCVIVVAERGVECADSGCGVCVASKAEEDERPASLAPLSHPRLPLSSFISSRRFCCVVFLQHADPTLSVPATHAVGLVCDSSLSCGDVEGVLSGGVVEKVCSCVEGAKEVGKEVGKVLGLLRVVEKLCVGLKGALRSAQKQEHEQKEKEKQKEKSGKKPGQAGQNEEESRDRWSLGSRCQSALDLMENTLLGLCSARESEENESSADVDVEVTGQAGWILAVHFPHVLSGGRKEVGVIGVDVSGERRAMEEERKAEREEMKKMREEMETLKEEMKREMKKREEERKKEHELKMAELNKQAEQHKRFIEEGEERERRREEERKREEARRKEEMKRQSKVGAAAIEWFPADGYSLSGSVFTLNNNNGYHTLLSAEFGNVVVRFTFTFQKITASHRIGIVASAQTATVKSGSYFVDLVGGAGWNVESNNRNARQNNNTVQSGSACAAGRGGQRVVLEADGRDGKRTLRLSQDGQTQHTFFSRIPVPFRFAIRLCGAGDAVSIESVEVVAEPQVSGGETEIRMDEA